MKINNQECLALLHCDVNGDMMLHLDKGGAHRLINGPPITSGRVVVEFTYADFSYLIPLRMVPLLWGLRILTLFYKLSGGRGSMWYHRQWDKIVDNQDPYKVISDRISAFKIGVIKE